MYIIYEKGEGYVSLYWKNCACQRGLNGQGVLQLCGYFAFQSLLCSKFTSNDLYRHLLEKLDKNHDLIGWDSLFVLAKAHVNPTEAADYILDTSPCILTEFASSLAQNHQDVVITSFFKQISSSANTNG